MDPCDLRLKGRCVGVGSGGPAHHLEFVLRTLLSDYDHAQRSSGLRRVVPVLGKIRDTALRDGTPCGSPAGSLPTGRVRPPRARRGPQSVGTTVLAGGRSASATRTTRPGRGARLRRWRRWCEWCRCSGAPVVPLAVRRVVPARLTLPYPDARTRATRPARGAKPDSEPVTRRCSTRCRRIRFASDARALTPQEAGGVASQSGGANG